MFENGDLVRFVANRHDIAAAEKRPWPSISRILFLQHASDPVVWWDPGTILRKPDWLREKRGPDVHPGIRWIPLITFLQISADMVASDKVPDGHGHNYSSEILRLAGDPQVPGWTDGKSARLGPELARYWSSRYCLRIIICLGLLLISENEINSKPQTTAEMGGGWPVP